MIAIWGASGFIGRHAVRLLAEAGGDMKLFGRNFDAGFPFPLPASARTFKYDFSAPDSYIGDIRDCRAALLLVSASRARTFASDQEQEVTQNIVPYKNFFDALADTAIEHIVYLSSSAVYGITGAGPVPETHPAAPVSPYGRAKLAIEDMLKECARAKNRDYTILRVANPVGEWNEKPNLISLALKAVRTGESMTVWDASAVRDYFDVNDLARAIGLLLDPAAPRNEIFNVGSGRGFSVGEVLAMIGEVAGRPVPIFPGSLKNPDIPYNVLDCRKIHGAIGWDARNSLKDVIKRMWAEP